MGLFASAIFAPEISVLLFGLSASMLVSRR